ncbi:thioredoxin family protein [Streptomyces anulatus]
MITLMLIGLLGGLITAVSPCILPVLPVVFLAGGSGRGEDAGKPVRAPGGAGAEARGGGGTAGGGSVATAPPDAPGRPPRNRRPYAVVAGLVVSFAFFTLLGVTIISALGLPQNILRYVGLGLLVLIGLGLIFPPVERLLEKPFALDVTAAVQRSLPDYTSGVQRKIEDSDAARQQLSGLYDNSNKELSRCEDGADELRSCGKAPALEGIDSWFNTPGDRPVDLKSLRGKVTLIDFWTYSCINCQRAVPHIRDWERAYRDAGLRVIGVHSPEFAFEKKRSNVVAGAEKLGVDWPVALDNDLATWDNYRNRFWPAKYLIDADGTVRYFKFGEGQYDRTENMIRELLRQADPTVALPKPTDRAMDDLAADRTPETYLSNLRIRGYVGTPLVDDQPTVYRFPKGDLPLNKLSLDGTWTAGYEEFTAGRDARLAFTYRAKNANVVLAGTGEVTVLVNGEVTKTLRVTGSPTLYRLADDRDPRTARLELRVDEGLQAYVFTFG